MVIGNALIAVRKLQNFLLNQMVKDRFVAVIATENGKIAIQETDIRKKYIINNIKTLIIQD